MSVAIPTILAIRTEVLNAWRALDPTISTSRNSDAFIRAHVAAVASWGIYAKLKEVSLNILPSTSNSAQLRRHAALRGLTPEPAATSTGEEAILLTGTPAAAIGVDELELIHADGTRFVTTDAAGQSLDGSGELTVSAVSTTAGAIANKETGEVLTVVDPPAGIDNTAEVVADFLDGRDDETDQELLYRLLDRMRNPPAGGNRSDYRQWALEVDGVTEAFVYPGNRQWGTVDVCITTAAESRLPSPTLLTNTLAYIEERRPIGLIDVQVRQPDLVSQAVTATFKAVTGADNTVVQEAIEASLNALFRTLAPGDALRRSVLSKAIQDTEGVEYCNVTVPSADVTCAVTGAAIQLLSPGTYTITPV